MLPNNTLERTVKYRGRIVLAKDCVLADAQRRWGPTAQLGRYTSRGAIKVLGHEPS